MSAEVLRQAAALMRERAEAATTHTAWQLLGADDDYARPWTVASTHPEGERTYVCENARHTGEHIASWHPVVALAVADWLDRTADDHDQWYGSRAACRSLNEHGEEAAEGFTCTCSYKDCYEHGKWHNCTHGQPRIDDALAVARAYLNADAKEDAR